jgi:hypothetical protein
MTVAITVMQFQLTSSSSSSSQHHHQSYDSRHHCYSIPVSRLPRVDSFSRWNNTFNIHASPVVVVLTLHWFTSSCHHQQSHPEQYHLLSHSTWKVRFSPIWCNSPGQRVHSFTPRYGQAHSPPLAQHHISSTTLRKNILHFLHVWYSVALIRPLVPYQQFHFNPAFHTDSTTTWPQIPLDSASDWIPR